MNGSIRKTFTLNTQDSLLYIDSFLPNQTYKIKALLNTTDYTQPTTNELTVTTMDTTSHNFTWQTWTFGGQAGSCTLYDVAIIDENNIWAVGEIYLLDSLGNPDPNAYNAVHWDGSNWELKRINMRSSCNTVTYPPLKAIWAFSTNDIVVTSGGSIGWFNGIVNKTDCNIRPLLSGSINRLWGSSSNDLYAVGNDGNIVHYNGNGWTKIESGTSANITDISGIQNENGKSVKYCTTDNVLLRIDSDDNVSRININQGMYLNSVWAASNRLIYTAGNGIVLYKNENWQNIDGLNMNTIYGVKGQSYNDIVGLSSNLSIFHFNGYSWDSIQTGLDKIYLKIQIKDNSIATVGWQSNKALVTPLLKN